MKVSKKIVLVSMAAALFVLVSAPAAALTTYWNASTASWHTAGNWDNGVPTISDTAYVANGGTAQITGTANARYLYVGGTTTSTISHISGTTTFDYYLIVGQSSGQTGVYNMADAAVLTSTGAQMFVGYDGTGTFVNDYGTHTLNPDGGGWYGELTLGYNSGSSGTYELDGNAPAWVGGWTVNGRLTANEVTIGRSGTGAFTQYGGLHEANSMTIASMSGSTGTYNLSSGVVDIAQQTVSSRGNATFNHTGGSNQFTSLYIGRWQQAGSKGTYNLHGTGANLSGTAEYIGYSGEGEIDQIGGSNNAGTIYLGYNSTGQGTYTLTTGAFGASVSTDTMYIGYSGSGALTQNHGTSSHIDNLYVGYNSGSTGEFTINYQGTSTCTANIEQEYIGYSGTGVVNQTGSTHTYHSLNLGATSTGHGTYNLSGGTLESDARVVYIGYEGTGVFNHTGGSNILNDDGYGWYGELYLGNNSTGDGTYNLSGTGQLEANWVTVGRSGTGDFNQSGGTHTVNDLTVAGSAGSTGTYDLTGGTLNAEALTVSSRGDGTFTHSGGTNNVTTLSLAGQNQAGIQGTYNLSGSGQISATNERIGYRGTGVLSQTGGTNAVTNLYVGYNSGSNGEYRLQGGTNTVTSLYIGYNSGSDGEYVFSGGTISANSITIGNYGTGAFTQSGSTTHQWTYLTLGRYSGGHGTYNLNGGTLTSDARTMYLGYEGAGVINQSAGSNILNDSGGWYGELYLGYMATGDGTYNLSGSGQLNANWVDVGRQGTGDFNQSGGTHTVNQLTVAGSAGSTGTYDMTGGTLNAGTLTVSSRGDGTFTHSAGTNNVTTLTLGNQLEAGITGTYNLSASGQIFATNIRIGYNGTGEFNQTGGTNTVSGTLYLGYNSTGDGTYSLTGGTLNTGDLLVGHNGTGTLTVGGGDLNVGGDFAVDSFFDITYNISLITIGGDITFEDGAVFSAVAGSTIHLTGSNFYNESTSASNLAGLGDTEFIFEGGAGVLDTFEVAGLVDGGFVDNFALGALTLGGADVGHLQMVDDTDNGNRGTEGEECLFVFNLTINAGSSLDVNGFILYESGDHADEWNTWIGDGWLFDGLGGSLNAVYNSDDDWTTFGGGVIPEPGTIVLVGAALAGMAGVIRKRLK